MAKKPRKPPNGGPPNRPNADPADIPLNEDERRFVDEFIIDRNACRAYRTTFPNCSHHEARVDACRMRNRPNVKREIDAAIRAQSIRTRVDADKVLKEITRIALSDVYDLYDPVTHQLRHPRHIPYETRKAIASMRVKRERRSVRMRGRTRTTVIESEIEYRFWPKMEALGKLCRHLGLDTEITPLEALLRALPAELANQVRGALTNAIMAPSTNGQQTAK